MPRRTPVDRFRALAAVTVVFILSNPSAATAQQPGENHTGSTLAGAALGFYSGSVLGTAGSLLPCNRTLLGPKCALVSALGAGAVGSVAGALIGSDGASALRDRGRGALYGILIGGVAGAILQQGVRQYAWNDALLVAAYGAAIGAAPLGTLVGTGVGAAVGGLAWVALPRTGLADLVMLTLVGSTLGSLYDWVDGASDAGGVDGPVMAASLSVPFL